MRPEDFYSMSMREFYAAVYANAPPEERERLFETDDPFFSEDELEKLADMSMWH